VLITTALMSATHLAADVDFDEQVTHLLEDAHQRFADKDYSGAKIQLKNMLQLTPSDSRALLLMGQTQLRLGDAEAAEHFFSALINTQDSTLPAATRNLAAQRLAEAYLKQGKINSILFTLPSKNLTPETRAELLGYQAIAYTSQNDTEQSQHAVEQAFLLAPRALVANVAECQRHIAGGDAKQALALRAQLTQDEPASARGLQCLGTAAQALNDLPAALNYYAEAIKQDPHLINARINQASLLVYLRREDEAATALNFLLQHYPREPRAAYLRALLFELAGDLIAAEIEFRRCAVVFSVLPVEAVASSAQLTMQAALAHQRIGEQESARRYLNAYNTLHPDNLSVASALATLLLESKNPLKALAVITPGLRHHPENASLLRLKARAFHLTGAHQKAARVEQQFRQLDPRQPLPAQPLPSQQINLASQQALAAIQRGDLLKGLSQINRLIDDQRLPIQQSIELARSYLNSGRLREALVLAAGIVKQQPDEPNHLNLLGDVLLRAQKNQHALTTLQRSVRLDPTRIDSHQRLARAEASTGQIDKARRRLEGLSNNQRIHGEAALQLAQLERQAGNQQRALQLAELLVEHSPNWFQATALLTQLYMETKQVEPALALAKESVGLDKNNVSARFLLAKLLEDSGQRDTALASYRLLGRNFQTDASVLERVARRQIHLQGFADASNSLYRLLQLHPKHLPSRLLYIRLQLDLGLFDAALELSEQLTLDHPELAEAHAIKAQSLAKLKRHRAAYQSHTRASQLQPENSAYLVGQFNNLAASGQIDKAEKLLERGRREQPKNALLTFTKIEFLLGQERLQAGIKAIEEALEHLPNNALLLNNMAFALHKLEKKTALGFARRAQNLAPQLPQINDTLGWILVEQGQVEQGIGYLEQAVKLQPDAPQLRYHLGAAYLALRQHSRSRQQLKRALASEQAFSDRAAASVLLEQLEEDKKQ